MRISFLRKDAVPFRKLLSGPSSKFVLIPAFCCLAFSVAFAQKAQTRTVEAFSDNACQFTQGSFTVPAGGTATNFVFSFNTSWQACSGPDRMDWIIFGIRGGAGAMVYECTEFWDRRPAQERPGPASGLTAGPGTYYVYLLSGRNSSVKVTFAMTGGGTSTTSPGSGQVTAARDADCKSIPGTIVIGPGCTATNFRYKYDTPWLQCTSLLRVDQMAFTIRGAGGDLYDIRVYWDQRPVLERLGPLSRLVLGPGSYTLILESGRNSTVTFTYDLSCPPPTPGTAYESAALLSKFETSFKQWYEKIGGSFDASIFVEGTDKQQKNKLTWNAISKNVFSEHEYTVKKPGRVYIVVEFRMEDRPEYKLARLFAVGSVYFKFWDGKAWKDYPPAAGRGWQNYIGYAGSREVLPDPQFKFTGKLGDTIQVLGPGMRVNSGKYQLAILSAIARDWVAHFPSKGKIYIYFIPD